MGLFMKRRMGGYDRDSNNKEGVWGWQQRGGHNRAMNRLRTMVGIMEEDRAWVGKGEEDMHLRAHDR